MRLAALMLLALLAGCGASAGAAPLDQVTPTPPRAYLPLVAQPAPTATPTTTIEPTPAPVEVIVRSSRSFTRSTSRYVVGEILNNTPNPVFFAQITARFLDGAGQLIATEDSFAFLTRTNPGQRNPFQIILSNAPTSFASYSLSVSTSTSSVLNYRDAAVLTSQVRDNFGVEVFGDVRNPEVIEMRSVEVAVAFYDANGDVVDVDLGFTSPTTIAPGATAPYSVKTFTEIAYASLSVQAQGYLAP